MVRAELLAENIGMLLSQLFSSLGSSAFDYSSFSTSSSSSCTLFISSILIFSLYKSKKFLSIAASSTSSSSDPSDPSFSPSSTSSSSSSILSSSIFNSSIISSQYHKRRYRCVALDLDGTTLNNHHELSQRTIQTINQLIAKGVQFLIASGRTSSSIHNVIQLLHQQNSVNSPGKHRNLTSTTSSSASPQHSDVAIVSEFDREGEREGEREGVDDDYILPCVCFNGACGVEISSVIGIKSIVFESFLNLSSTEKLLAYAHQHGYCAQYYIPDTGVVYASPQNDIHRSLLERYALFTGKKQHYVSNYEYPKSLSLPAKILLLVEEKFADELLNDAKSRFGEEFHIVRGSPSPFFIEFLSPGTNKGSGLKKLCEHLKISLDSVISFGDGENDEEFLRYAGLGIAMKNARPLAKEAANITLEWTNDEDGVARQLERMELEGWFDI